MDTRGLNDKSAVYFLLQIHYHPVQLMLVVSLGNLPVTSLYRYRWLKWLVYLLSRDDGYVIASLIIGGYAVKVVSICTVT